MTLSRGLEAGARHGAVGGIMRPPGTREQREVVYNLVSLVFLFKLSSTLQSTLLRTSQDLIATVSEDLIDYCHEK